MARANRLLFDSCFYHVLTRGNQKQAIFHEESDYLKYLDILRHYKKECGFKLFCYCLMPNHVHLLLGLIDGKGLSRIMLKINLTYTSWYNDKYKKVGHLWQGRFKSLAIQSDDYLLKCMEYVENNPVRAGITVSPFEYPYSSAKFRILEKFNKLLDVVRK